MVNLQVVSCSGERECAVMAKCFVVVGKKGPCYQRALLELVRSRGSTGVGVLMRVVMLMLAVVMMRVLRMGEGG